MSPFLRLLPLLLLVAGPGLLGAQGLDWEERRRGHRMLETLREDIEKHYYDTTFGGVDLAAAFARADSAIEAAGSFPQVLGLLADFVRTLDDSHTWFDPPPITVRAEYGIGLGVVGEHAYVTSVREESDAAARGVAVGDRVVRLNRQPVTRTTLPLLEYVYYLLRPTTSLILDLEKPDGATVTRQVAAAITREPSVLDLSNEFVLQRIREAWDTPIVTHETVSFEERALVWRMPEFRYADRHLGGIMKDARKYPGLVIDLRGNPGGAVVTQHKLLGYFFAEHMVIGRERTRKKIRDIEVRPRGGTPYEGTVVILLDAQSGSSSEIVARVLQREGKATVVGDRSAGAVATSEYRDHRIGGATRFAPYGIAITVSDFETVDGERLEGVGVVPDSLVLPTPQDLAAGRDPALALALRLVGVDLTPEQAGTLYERD